MFWDVCIWRCVAVASLFGSLGLYVASAVMVVVGVISLCSVGLYLCRCLFCFCVVAWFYMFV